MLSSTGRQFVNPTLFQPTGSSALPTVLEDNEGQGNYISDKPFPLFEFDSAKEKWIMKNEAFKVLSSFRDAGKIKVVSVVGAYRLGKSYLMNQIMHCKKGGFELGHTTESKTKGVWVWGEVIQQDPHLGKHVLLCLDSEGLLDVDRDSETFDMSLFCILTMLSSYMIINLEKRISSDDLNKLAFASDFTNMIVTDQMEEQDYNHNDISLYTPQLLWLIRDFTLKLKGNETDYLEEILNDGNSEDSKRKKSQVHTHQIKKNIKKYFHEKMELKTLPCPSSDEDVLTSIEENGDQLSEKFVNGMNSLVKHIRLTSSIKKVISPKDSAEVELDTMTFFIYCKSLVDQLNENAQQIQIPNTFEAVLQQQLDTILNETLDAYDDCMNSFTNKFPMEEDSLLESHEEVAKIVITKALHQVPHFKREEFHKLLLKMLGESSFRDNPEEIHLDKESRLCGLLERNLDESERYCERIYTTELRPIKTKMYTDVNECRQDLQHLRSSLTHQLIGPAMNKFINKFLIEAQEIMKQTILYQKIDQAEKEKELLKIQIQRINEERKIQEEKFDKERNQMVGAMQSLKNNQEVLQNQIQIEKQATNSEILNLRTQLNNKQTPTTVYVQTPAASSSSSSSRSRRYYSSSDDDDYCSGRGGGGRSGKGTFYKGGQFIPGGGRAPKGGIWM